MQNLILNVYIKITCQNESDQEKILSKASKLTAVYGTSDLARLLLYNRVNYGFKKYRFSHLATRVCFLESAIESVCHNSNYLQLVYLLSSSQHKLIWPRPTVADCCNVPSLSSRECSTLPGCVTMGYCVATCLVPQIIMRYYRLCRKSIRIYTDTSELAGPWAINVTY